MGRPKTYDDYLNKLAEYAQSQLPAGYQITITFDSDETSLSLTDPNGEDINERFEDFVDVCATAREHAIEHGNEG